MSATILIIDDSEDDQRLYRRAFKDFDNYFTLVTASSAEAGLVSVADARPDLILLDYSLPDMDGLGFMERLDGNPGTRIPIVMLTGEGSAEVAVEVMKHGADDYLVKDTEGRYLRLLPGVAGRVVAAHAQREMMQRLRQEAEDKFHLLFESANDCLLLLSMDGRILDINRIGYERLGYTKEEMLGRRIAEFDTPEFAARVPERVAEILREGQATFESAHVRKDGSKMPVEVSSRPVEINGEKVLYSVIRDITEHKNAEAMLKRHKLVIDTSIDGFWVTDMQGHLLEANEAYAKMSGYAVEELVKMHISQLEAIEQADDVKAHIAKIIAQGYDSFETRHRHKDGHEIDIEISVTCMAEPPQMVVFCRDISKRKRAEAALLRSEANLHAMLDNSPYLAWLKDAKGRYITVNKVFADYHRLADASQATGKTDLDLQPKELAEKYRAEDAEVMASRKHKHVEESAFDGKKTHWVETWKTPIIDARGKVLGTVGFASDITARKEVEEALHVAAAAFETRDAIVITDADANIIRVNRAFSDITGYSTEEVLGKNPRIMRSGRHDKAFYQDMWQQLVQNGTWSGEIWDKRKSGRIYPKWMTITAVKNDRQVTTRYVGIFSDITERKMAEAEILLQSGAYRKRAEILAQQFGHLLQSSFNEIYLFDANDLHFLQVSEGAKKNLGYSDDELGKLTPLDLQPSFSQKSFGKLLVPLRSGAQQTLLFESLNRRKDGTTYPVEVCLQLMEAEPRVFMGIIQDITGRKQAERQLREFSAHLQSVREEEKAHIAREIHDDLGGTLTALKMEFYLLANEAAREASTSLAERIGAMSQLLDSATNISRRIISDLYPTMLDAFGLQAALEWQAGQFNKHTGIECQVKCTQDDGCEIGLSKTQAINLFRIFQETLTNVAKHSGASRVEAEFHNGDEIVLSVRDNGRGLPAGHTIASTSYGMRGMIERVKQLEGEIKFDSPPGGGFEVTVRLPAGCKEGREKPVSDDIARREPGFE